MPVDADNPLADRPDAMVIDLANELIPDDVEGKSPDELRTLLLIRKGKDYLRSILTPRSMLPATSVDMLGGTAATPTSIGGGGSGGGFPPGDVGPPVHPGVDEIPGGGGSVGGSDALHAGTKWDDLPHLVKEIRDAIVKGGSRAVTDPEHAGLTPEDHERVRRKKETEDADARKYGRGMLGGLLDRVRKSPLGTAVGTAYGAVAGTRVGRAAGGSARWLGRQLGRPFRGLGRGLGKIPGVGRAGRAAGGLGKWFGRGAKAFLFGDRSDPDAAGAGEGKPPSAPPTTGAFGGPGGLRGPAGEAEGGAMSRLGGGAAAAAAALYKLGKAAVDLGYAQEQKMRELAKVSPSQAMNLALLDINRIQRGMEKGEATAGTGGKLTESLNRFENALQPISIAVENLLNSIGSGVLDTLADGVKRLVPVIDKLIDALNWVGRNVVAMINKIPGNHFDWEDFKKGGEKQENQLAPLLERLGPATEQARDRAVELSNRLRDIRRQHEANDPGRRGRGGE